MASKNKFVAVQRGNGRWFAAIECGKWNMVPASFQFFTNKETGMVYRWFLPILNPAPDLQPYQEIFGKETQFFEQAEDEQMIAEGYEEQENMILDLLYKMGVYFGLDRSKVSEFIEQTNKSGEN